MATIRFSENRRMTCENCGARNVVRIAYAPGPAEEWWDINCASCGGELAAREKQGLVVVELQDPTA